MDEGGDVGGADGIFGMDNEVWDLEVIVDAVVEEGVKEFDYGCCFTVGPLLWQLQRPRRGVLRL